LLKQEAIFRLPNTFVSERQVIDNGARMLEAGYQGIPSSKDRWAWFLGMSSWSLLFGVPRGLPLFGGPESD
jgi:hypothetical protein